MKRDDGVVKTRRVSSDISEEDAKLLDEYVSQQQPPANTMEDAIRTAAKLLIETEGLDK